MELLLLIWLYIMYGYYILLGSTTISKLDSWPQPNLTRGQQKIKLDHLFIKLS